MAERAKSDDINRNQLIQLVIRTFGNRRNALFISHSEYALKSADLATKMFYSRNDADYICFVPCDDILERSETIWAATLLSHLCETADIIYDDVCDLTNVSVAGFIHWVVPDKTISLLEGTQIVLSQLAQVNSYMSCGPIFSVLAKALIAADLIGKEPSVGGTSDKHSKSAFATRLWNISTTIKQLDYAMVSNWSPFVAKCLEYGKSIIENWDLNGDCPLIQFRSGDNKHNIDWHMDMTLPPKPREYKEWRDWKEIA